MHIAILSAIPTATSGWGRYTRDLVTALAAQGVQITLLTSADAPSNIGLPVTNYHRVLPSAIPLPRAAGLRMLLARRAVAKLTATCDVIHATAEPYAISAPPDKPLVVTAHGTYIPKTLYWRFVGGHYRRSYQRASIISVSSYTDRQVRAVLPTVQPIVIPNGVDAARYQRQVTLPRKQGPTLLCVGALKARKGYHILAQAMKTIRQAVPDARAVFIGDDSDIIYRHLIGEILERDQVADAVTILGRVPDEVLLGWYQAADAFVLPALNVDGKFEGFGLVYLEASAAGIPVIGTLDCGAEDAIVNDETGYLIPQNNPSALAEAAIRLLRDASLRQRMGAAGRAFAAAHTWDHIASQVIDIYKRQS